MIAIIAEGERRNWRHLLWGKHRIWITTAIADCFYFQQLWREHDMGNKHAGTHLTIMVTGGTEVA